MSIVGKIFDIFGQGDKKFYARDFRNAYQFRPDVNPPRQQFEGYVSFVLNRSLYEQFFKEQGQEFRLQIGSLVRRASLPNVEFKTETKNQYNRKKIVNTTTDFQPVSITVLDTVNNEWLTLLMKYYTYHYMNARNEGNGNRNRDLGRAPDYETQDDFFNSKFGLGGTAGSAGWDSNKYGYNPNITSYFFERIDYVLYHGNRGVQYSLINPVLTGFKTTDLDYSESGLMNFDLTFEYENFTIHNEVNFELSQFDIDRFEPAGNFTGPAFSDDGKPLPLRDGFPAMPLDILGDSKDSVLARHRSAQPQITPAPDDVSTASPENSQPDRAGDPPDPTAVQSTESSVIVVTGQRAPRTDLPSTYGDAAKFAGNSGLGKTSFLEGLLTNVADAALSAAINGTNIRDVTLNTVIGGVLQEIEPQFRQIGQAAVRPEKETPAEDITLPPPPPAVPPLLPPGGITFT